MCKGCRLVQRSVESPPVKRNALPEKPWETIVIDLMGPLLTGENLLIITDYYSRYIELTILKSISAMIKNELFEMFVGRGLSRTIVSDNGQQFTDEGLKE